MLNPEALKLSERFGGIWGEHPDWPARDWAREALDGDTRLGYWEWVLVNREHAAT